MGLVENMAWFTPAELPENKYYIFGNGGVSKLAQESGSELIAQIPIVESVCKSGDSGEPIALDDKSLVGEAFSKFADNFISAVNKRNVNLPPTKQVNVK